VLPRIALVVVPILLGIVAALVLDGLAGTLAAMTLIGIALVIAVCLMFYEVGLSEDRERERGGPGSPYG
jgi:hypothetical protein